MIGRFTDKRQKPRISTQTVGLAAFIMIISRLGSLNGLRQTFGSQFWKAHLQAEIPSDDTIGRVFKLLTPDPIRDGLRKIYTQLKQNKALEPLIGSRFAIVLDGHESSASFLRCCEQCLERRVRTAKGERIQYYHRNVTALLLCKKFPLLLDVEEQKKGENEMAAAIRLLIRLLKNYGRAFEMIIADALYANTDFFQLAITHNKEVIAVLKENRPDLLTDAVGLFKNTSPISFQDGDKMYTCWDEESFCSWPQIEKTVRVVRSIETYSVLRQKDSQKETKSSEWLWVATASKSQIPTRQFIQLAHARWVIENQELNELVNYWHVDHIYKHDPNAILAFWLLALLAYNLFHAFLYLNMKAVLRDQFSKLHWSRLMAAELYYPLRC